MDSRWMFLWGLVMIVVDVCVGTAMVLADSEIMALVPFTMAAFVAWTMYEDRKWL
jgi:hypothetical protein